MVIRTWRLNDSAIQRPSVSAGADRRRSSRRNRRRRCRRPGRPRLRHSRRTRKAFWKASSNHNAGISYPSNRLTAPGFRCRDRISRNETRKSAWNKDTRRPPKFKLQEVTEEMRSRGIRILSRLYAISRHDGRPARGILQRVGLGTPKVDRMSARRGMARRPPARFGLGDWQDARFTRDLRAPAPALPAPARSG
jgi:hypothetical protein